MYQPEQGFGNQKVSGLPSINAGPVLGAIDPAWGFAFQDTQQNLCQVSTPGLAGRSSLLSELHNSVQQLQN